jgi:hypothetical protein
MYETQCDDFVVGSRLDSVKSVLGIGVRYYKSRRPCIVCTGGKIREKVDALSTLIPYENKTVYIQEKVFRKIA